MEPANQAQGQTLKVYGLCVCGRGDSKPCQNAGIDPLQLGKLFSQVADVLHESGCWCLAERFKGMSLALGDLGKNELGFDVGQQNKQNNNGKECCLFSLSSALSTAAYYDHALDCAKLAGQIETSRELVYLQAFLYLALGETEQACKLYKQAASGLGSIRLEELEQIQELVHQHISEEDILEIYEELAYHCKKNANLLNLR